MITDKNIKKFLLTLCMLHSWQKIDALPSRDTILFSSVSLLFSVNIGYRMGYNDGHLDIIKRCKLFIDEQLPSSIASPILDITNDGKYALINIDLGSIKYFYSSITIKNTGYSGQVNIYESQKSLLYPLSREDQKNVDACTSFIKSYIDKKITAYIALIPTAPQT